MIEAAGGLPGVERVAARAVLAECPAMFIRMAGAATGRQAKQGVIAVLDADGGALRLHDMRRIVAALAGESGMLAHQRISGLAMVEVGLRRVPLYDVEVFTVMLCMTARAIFVILRVLHNPGMVALPRRDALPDLAMTAQAAEARGARSKDMAGPAFGGAA